jgi:hypothetical protein
MNSRTDSKAVEKEEIYFPYRKFNLSSSVIQPVA